MYFHDTCPFSALQRITAGGRNINPNKPVFCFFSNMFRPLFFPVLVSAVQLDILMSTDSRGNRMAGLPSLMHIKVTSWKRSQKVLRYQKIGNYNTQLSESTSTIAWLYDKLLICWFKRSHAEYVTHFVALTENKAPQDTEQWLFQLPYFSCVLQYKKMWPDLVCICALELLFIIWVIQYKSLDLNVPCHAVKIKVYRIVLWKHAVPKNRTEVKRPISVLNNEMLIKQPLHVNRTS